jgi:hypothetical protein
MTDLMNAEPKLPAQIQAEVDLAEQIEKEIAASLAQDQPSADTLVSEEVVEEHQTPIEAPQPDLQSTEAPQTEDPNSETWQARYNALQGKYNAEVPRLHQQLREISYQVDELRSQRQTPEPQPKDLEVDRQNAVDNYGEEIVDYIHRAAQAEAERRIAELKQSQQLVEQRVAQSEHDRFFAQMDTAVPGWRDIDTNPAWLGWLQEYDPLLGAPRQAALDQAANSHDVGRATYLFNLFKESQRPTAATANGFSVGTPHPSRAQLEQVTPRPTGNATASPMAQARFYSQAEIQKLLDPRYLRQFPREQQVAIERDIDLAVAEGRIAA